MDIHSGSEKSIGYFYYILLLIIVIAVAVFLLCDFGVLPGSWCTVINKFVTDLANYTNKILGI